MVVINRKWIWINVGYILACRKDDNEISTTIQPWPIARLVRIRNNLRIVLTIIIGYDTIRYDTIQYNTT